MLKYLTIGGSVAAVIMFALLFPKIHYIKTGMPIERLVGE